jgi:hypothetical protein
MHRSIPVDHAQHDLDLIAGHAAGDLSDPERLRADAVLGSCASCADLRRDLVAIASATRTLPARTAPRDFRLTETQAASLRRGGWITSLLRPFAAPRSTVRPMALAFTSLGLAGLLVANILPALFGNAGAAGSAAAPEDARALPAASAGSAATAGPVAVPVAGGPQATDSRDRSGFGLGGKPTAALDQFGGSKSNQATAAPGNVAGEPDGSEADASEQAYLERLAATARDKLAEDTTNPLLIGSLALLAIGLALFGLRFVARRVP